MAGTPAARFALISVPYDSGLYRHRFGAGAHQLTTALRSQFSAGIGTDVELYLAERPGAEVLGWFESMTAVAHAVSRELRQGLRPMVVAGNCGTTVGVLSGYARADRSQPPVLWFDAHADFHTPETTSNGFVDGMALSVAMGRCWATLRDQLNLQALTPDRLLLVGARAIEAEEHEALDALGVRSVESFEQARHALVEFLEGCAEPVHVHIDLDVLDPTVAPASSCQPHGGLSPEDLAALLRLVSRVGLSSLTLASYDPEVDRNLVAPPLLCTALGEVLSG